MWLAIRNPAAPPVEAPVVLAPPVHGVRGEHVLVADQHDVAVDRNAGGVEISLGTAPDIDQVRLQALRWSRGRTDQGHALVRTTRAVETFQHRLAS